MTTAVSYFNQGVEKYQIQQYAEAEADLKMAIRLNPDYAEAYYVLGCVMCERGLLSLSWRPHIDKALELARLVGNEDLQYKIEQFIQARFRQ